MPLFQCSTAVAPFCSAAENPSRSLLCAFPPPCSALQPAFNKTPDCLSRHTLLLATHTPSQCILYWVIYLSITPPCTPPAGSLQVQHRLMKRSARGGRERWTAADSDIINIHGIPKHSYLSCVFFRTPNENLLCFRENLSESHQPGKTRSSPFSFRVCCMAGKVISVMALSWLDSSREEVIMGFAWKEGKSVTFHLITPSWRH